MGGLLFLARNWRLALALVAVLALTGAAIWTGHRLYRAGYAAAVAAEAARVADAQARMARAAEAQSRAEAGRLAAEAAAEAAQREAEDAARADLSGGGITADRVRRLNAAAGGG